MTNEDQKKIFSKNLCRYVAESGKQQKEVAKDLGINATTFNMWCTGKAIPGTGKLGTLAKYFRIGLSDLVDEKVEKEVDAEFSRAIMEISLTDKRFMNIILEYNKLPADKKDLLCDFFEKFVF